MYGIKYDNVKKGYFYNGILLFLGIIIFLGLNYLSHKNHLQKLSYDSKTESLKVEYDAFTYTYYYNVNGQEYSYKEYNYEALDKEHNYNSMKVDKDTERKAVLYYKSSNPIDCISESEYNSITEYSFLPILSLFIPFNGLIGIIDIKKNITKMKWLSINGTLIKNLEYEVIRKGSRRFGSYYIVVNYKHPNGEVIRLVSDRKYFLFDRPKYVDLLIDPNDTNNFYIDFHIYQL